jgi:hypothetical protein
LSSLTYPGNFFLSFLREGRIKSLAKKLDLYRFIVSIFLVDTADLTDIGVPTGRAIVIQFTVCTLDFPARELPIFEGRAFQM